MCTDQPAEQIYSMLIKDKHFKGFSVSLFLISPVAPEVRAHWQWISYYCFPIQQSSPENWNDKLKIYIYITRWIVSHSQIITYQRLYKVPSAASFDASGNPPTHISYWWDENKEEEPIDIYLNIVENAQQLSQILNLTSINPRHIISDITS